jgi:hypothetical protein
MASDREASARSWLSRSMDALAERSTLAIQLRGALSTFQPWESWSDVGLAGTPAHGVACLGQSGAHEAMAAMLELAQCQDDGGRGEVVAN